MTNLKYGENVIVRNTIIFKVVIQSCFLSLNVLSQNKWQFVILLFILIDSDVQSRSVTESWENILTLISRPKTAKFHYYKSKRGRDEVGMQDLWDGTKPEVKTQDSRAQQFKNINVTFDYKV